MAASTPTRIRQRTQGTVSMLPQQGTLEIDPDERLEREAEQTAQEVMQGGTLGIQRMPKADVHVQRMSDGVSASNAKNIQEMQSELADLKSTVDRHDETIQEIESMKQAVDDAYDDLDPDDVQVDVPGGTDQEQSTLESMRESLGNMGNKMNPLSEGGQQTLAKGAIGGSLALGAFALGGGALGVAAALGSPILGDAAAAGIGDAQQAVPEAVVEQLGSSLAASEDFAKRIAGDPQLAKELASNETLLGNLKSEFQSRDGQSGAGDSTGDAQSRRN